MKRVLFAIIVTAGAPVWAGTEKQAVTPSGRPEIIFRKTSQSDASGKLSGQCMANGLTVVNTSSGDVTCELKMNLLKGALAQALLGNSYSTPPRSFVHFSVAQYGVDTKVQANSWIETQMVFGQVRRQEMTNDDTHNDLMAFMTAAGGDLPGGTTFPNHVYLGTNPGGSGTAASYKGKNTAGVMVSSFIEGGPMARAGAQPNDIIVAVNGKTFKDGHEFTKRLNKIPLGEKVSVSVIRAGAPLDMMIVSERRPPTAADTFVAAATPAPVEAQSLAPLSIADEIGKLAVLRDKGIITEAEFQAKKLDLLK